MCAKYQFMSPISRFFTNQLLMVALVCKKHHFVNLYIKKNRPFERTVFLSNSKRLDYWRYFVAQS